MSHDELVRTACRLAAEQVGVDPDTVTPDMDLYNDLGFDSLDAVEYAMTLEDQLNIEIADEDMEGVRNLRQAIALLEKAVACPAN